MAYQYENVKLEKGMYGQNGRSFLKVLESLDPSENYKGTALEGLDAFQRQLKRFDIHVKGAGSDMVESVFSIPGLGSMLVTALGARDTITINACVLLTAVIFVLVNFIADCVNAFLNPQSQKGGGL